MGNESFHVAHNRSPTHQWYASYLCSPIRCCGKILHVYISYKWSRLMSGVAQVRVRTAFKPGRKKCRTKGTRTPTDCTRKSYISDLASYTRIGAGQRINYCENSYRTYEMSANNINGLQKQRTHTHIHEHADAGQM